MAEPTTTAARKRLLNPEQQALGYWVERTKESILVWHGKNNIACLLPTGNVLEKVQGVVTRRIEQLKEVEAKTGWKPDKIELPEWAEREPEE